MIKIKTFDRIIGRSQKRISQQEKKSIKNTINMIFKIINPVIYSEREKMQEKSTEEIKEIAYKAELAIQKILKDCLRKISYDVPTEDEAHILNSYQELLYNHGKRKEIYNKIKSMGIDELKKGYLEENIEKNEEFLMKQILYMYRKITKTISEKEYRFLNEYKRNDKVKKMAQNALSKEQIEKLNMRVKLVGKEEEKIEEAFQNSRDIFSENIRNKYITGLMIIGKIIKDFGLFSTYEQREDKRLEELGIEQEKTDLEQNFNREFLETLPIKTLIAMNVFWENRLTKEIESINNATFILQDLNLVEKILIDENRYEEFPFEKLSDKDLETEIVKTEFLREVTQICVEKMEKDIKKQKRQEEKVEEVDITPYVKIISDEYQEQYNKYFGTKLPEAINILRYDIENKYMTGRNIVDNLYKGKNASVLALIESCLTRDTIQNWGYIEEENDIEKFIVLGFDIEELNMPLRIHIPRSYLTTFLEKNNIDKIIPIYRGSEDFRRLGELIKTPVLIPMSPNIRKQIRNMEINRKGSIQKAMYIEHLKYLADTTTEKFPQHLKTTKIIGKGRKQKTKYLMKREYINLDTKQKYELDQNGKYIPKYEKEER